MNRNETARDLAKAAIILKQHAIWQRQQLFYVQLVSAAQCIGSKCGHNRDKPNRFKCYFM